MDKELLSIILVIILVIALFILIGISNNRSINKKLKERILKDLDQVNVLLGTKNKLVFRDIIIRLDTLLAKSLQIRLGNTDSCGDNLKKAKDLFNKDMYNQIWEIHKLRNKVVHENKDLNYSETLQGYNIIKSAIKKIQ